MNDDTVIGSGRAHFTCPNCNHMVESSVDLFPHNMRPEYRQMVELGMRAMEAKDLAKFVEGYVPNSILEQNILLSLRAAYAMGANQGEENKQVAVDAKEKEWSEYLTNSNREYAETCHKWEQIAHDACVWGDRMKAALQQIIGTAPEPQTPYERAIVTLAKNALEDNRPDGQ